jgi:hypothetical protein
LLVKSDEPSRLDNGDLPTPFKTRTDRLHGSVGAILSLPIGTHKKNIAANDHGTVVDATRFDLL